MSNGYTTLPVARAHRGCAAFRYSAGFGPVLPSKEQLEFLADWLEEQGERKAAKLLRDEKVNV